MNQHRTPETLVKETLDVEPAATDRTAVWQSIVERLGEHEAPARRPTLERVRRHLRLTRFAAVGLAALAATLAAVALLPAGDERDGSHAPLLATASAAEVLNATAMSARSALPAAGPGEYLFTRASSAIGGEGASTVGIESWTATDGSARIVEHERSSRPGRRVRGRCVKPMRSNGRAQRCTRNISQVTTTSYRSGSVIGVITANGIERRMPPPQLSPNWRYVVSGDEVVRLPAKRDALLASLRARAERAARVYERPRPKGYYPRVDRTYELAGRDLLVVETATDLLVEAPLSPGQRAAMLSMLADAPDWYQPGASAEPIQIRNLGPTKDALGRNGIALKFTIELTSDETGDETRGASPGTFDLVLDPKAGRLLETRSYEHGIEAAPVLLTVAAQRVVDAIDG
jgi:hypothetical protein